MFQYGFELECFYKEGDGITIPPEEWPHDNFPGLVEIRSQGASDLWDAWLQIEKQFITGFVDFDCLDFKTYHRFSPEEKRTMRARTNYEIKDRICVKNIYDSEPRDLGSKTMASLQVNISNLVRPSFKDRDGNYHAPIYDVFDVASVVKSLDQEFHSEIRRSRRQPGEYAIKGSRLEYRSLPSMCPLGRKDVGCFLDRIQEAVKNSGG